MPYEVIKRVRDRAYRYEVTSYRDPQSGKSRGVWRYLGRYFGPNDARSGSEQRPSSARECLLSAFVALVQKTSVETVTVAAITAKAGLAHATFYRHFKNKRAILLAALTSLREELKMADVDASSDAATERERIRALIRPRLVLARGRMALIRAGLQARFSDPEIAAFYEELFGERRRVLRNYIAAVNANGLGYGDDPDRLSAIVMILYQGIANELILRQETLNDDDFGLFAEVIERMLLR